MKIAVDAGIPALVFFTMVVVGKAWPMRTGHPRRSRVDYSQPPVNPARRSPASKAGQRRIMSQIRPER